MFTKFWYDAMFGCACGLKPTYTDMNGTTRTMMTSYFESTLQFAVSSTDKNTNKPCLYKPLSSKSDGGVIFGTGTTPVSFTDTNLSGDMITTFTASAAVTKEMTDAGFVVTSLYTITNTGAEAITIGEVGMMGQLYTSSSSTSGLGLFERTVLESPITIEPGGVGQVTYTISMNYPAAES